MSENNQTRNSGKPPARRRATRKDAVQPNAADDTQNAGLTGDQPRNSGTGETDAHATQRQSDMRDVTHVGDEGFSDSVTPASNADTGQTQVDHFREERYAQNQTDGSAGMANTQVEHFQEERHAQSYATRTGDNLNMTNNNMMRTVAAVYHSWDDATRAVQSLQDVGFDDDQIGIARLDDKKVNVQQVSTSGEVKDDAKNVAGGVATGAAVGGVAGLLAALASLAIPGVGPIVAGGVLATTFGTAAGTAIASAGVGAGIGAAAGGLIGSLTSLGLSEDEARAYESDLRGGSTLVTVRVDDGRGDEAIRVFQQTGGETRSRMSNRTDSNTDPNWRFG